MAAARFLPETTLAILLGASRGPNYEETGPSAAFANSCRKVQQYLSDLYPAGLGLQDDQVINRFDDKRPADAVADEIGQWLQERQGRFQDVLCYFVGHGAVLRDTDYYLLLSSTRKDAEVTGLPVKKLGVVLRKYARHFRRHLIIDACFSGKAVEGLLAIPGEALLNDLQKEKPDDRTPLRQIALLCSTSAEDHSKAPAHEPYTMFTGSLLEVLRWGHAQSDSEHFSLRTLCDLTADLIAKKYGSKAVRPQVHSSRDEEGDPAELPLFPNAAKYLQWCTIGSDAQHKAETSLDEVAHRLSGYGPKIERVCAKPLAPVWKSLHAAQVVESPLEFFDAVRTVCSCELAFFDVTDYEPVVMLLLGIRAVARRGVTVCSASRHSRSALDQDNPFHFKDINIVVHEQTAEHPEKALGDRALQGLKQLQELPHQYLDLPCFDTLRQVAPAGERRNRLPFYEQALVLCSFSPTYQKENWPRISRDLANALQQVIARDPDLRQREPLPEPRLVRTLDMRSPRLVSQALFEAIHRTDFCLIDWSEWRPSVFFELGTRLAVNELDPICIIEALDRGPEKSGRRGRRPQGKKLGGRGMIAEQCRRLLKLFPLIEYGKVPPSGKPLEAYQEMVERHKRLRDWHTHTRGSPTLPVPWSEGTPLPPGFTFNAVWTNVDAGAEPSAASVDQLLVESASALLIDESRGEIPFLYPKMHELTRKAQESGRERLLAAWLYLHYRKGAGPTASRDLAAAYVNLGWKVVEELYKSKGPNDKEQAEEILALLEKKSHE